MKLISGIMFNGAADNLVTGVQIEASVGTEEFLVRKSLKLSLASLMFNLRIK